MTKSAEEIYNSIPNIDETSNGVKYAYEKEGKFDTEYIANCIEFDEEFTSSFFAPSDYTGSQLFSIGNDIAMCYGGSCMSIDKVHKYNNDGTITVSRITRRAV